MNSNTNNNKNGKHRNVSLIHSKGYESENEIKSMNSTTTSSTVQLVSKNFENNGSSTTKNSARSLS